MGNDMPIGAEFFTANRQKLIDALPSSLIVLAGNREMQASGDAAYTFRQESNFWWLTGLSAPDWWLIIDSAKKKAYLVAPPRDETREVFDGQLTPDDIKKTTGVDAVLSDSEGDERLRQLIKSHPLAYSLGPDPHDAYYHFVKNPAQKDLWKKVRGVCSQVQDCRRHIARLRAIKSPAEIVAIKRAIKQTAAVFTDVHDRLAEFKYEYEIEAEFTYQFRRSGADGHAYDPIVAAGGNACTLHYSTNSSRIRKKDMILLDIGARINGYAADITRTYAMSEPTKRQAAVHMAVQQAHQEIISLLVPGLPTDRYLAQVDEVMKHTLHSLGLLKNMDDQEMYRRYFPHAISHGLGVDVHDSLGGYHELQPGMILTVEPGIYIPEENIGVRIEDNILITDDGQLNLSAALSTDY